MSRLWDQNHRYNVMANLQGQLAENHHPLSMSLGVFPERFNGEEKSHPECGWHHPIDLSHRFNKMRQTERKVRISISFSLLLLETECEQLGHVPAIVPPPPRCAVTLNHEPTEPFPSFVFTRAMRKITNSTSCYVHVSPKIPPFHHLPFIIWS